MRSIPKALKSGIKWTSAALLALLLIAALAVELISWNFLKPVIAERVEQATGRSFTIDGDLSLSLFPRPRLSAEGLRLSNPDWAQAPNMIELDHLSVSPSLSALLTGQLALARVELESLEVTLEASEQRKPNWVFQSSSTQVEQTSQQEPISAIPIEEMVITDTQLDYRGAEDASSFALLLPYARLADDGELLDARATFIWRERRFGFQIKGDSLYRLADLSEDFAAEMTLAAGDSQLQASFELPANKRFDGVSGQGKLSLKDAGVWSEWLGGPAIKLGDVELGLNFERESARWRFRQMFADLAPGSITGQAELVMDENAPEFNAKLHSDKIDLTRLKAMLSQGSEPEQDQTIVLPVFPQLDAELSLVVDQILLEDIQVENFDSRFRLSDHRLELEALSFGLGKAILEVTAGFTSAPDVIEVNASGAFKNLSPDDLGLSGLPQSLVGGQFDLALAPVRRSADLQLAHLVEHLRIDRAQLEYREANFNTELNARLSLSEAERKPELRVKGEFRQRPMEAEVNADPLAKLFSSSTDYAFEGRVNSGELKGFFQSGIDSIWPLNQLSATLELGAPNEQDLQAWVDAPLPKLPRFNLSARLQRDRSLWSFKELHIELGESRMTGSASFEAGQRPLATADLSGERIDLTPFLGQDDSKSNEREAKNSSGSNGQSHDSKLAILRALDARLKLRTDVLQMSEQRALTELAVEAKLEQGVLSVKPLNFELAQGSVTSSIHLDASAAPASGSLKAELQGVQLEQLVDSYTPLEEKLGKLSGTIQLEAVETHTEALRPDLPLAALGRLSLSDSELRFRDQQAGTDLNLNFSTQGLANQEQSLRITGAGQYDGDPFELDFTGDPVLNLRDPERPYQLKLEARVVETQFNLDGSLLRPLKLKGLDLQTVVSGSNPQDLNRLVGTPLPKLPRYSVAGNLTLKQQRWLFEELSGAVGKTDVRGEVAIDMGAEPPHLSGDLRSESLDMDDLRGLVGAEPEAEDRFLLPQGAILGEGLQKITADVSYQGKSVRVRKIPLSDLKLEFSLDDSQMRLQPVSFGVGDGNVNFSLEVDAGKRLPEGTMSVEVQGVDLRKALSEWDLADESVGIVGGRGKFWVKGRSVADLLASADGGMVILMTEGKLDALLVELAGIDVYQSFLSWIRDREPVAINCAYFDVKARAGLVTLDTAVIDSEDTSFTAAGQADFEGERLDVTIQAHPKDPSLLVGRTPLHLGGTFKNPEPSIEAEGLGARLAATAVLQAVATPAAALIPLLDYGAGDNSGYCQGIVSQTREAIDKNRE